MNMSSLRDGLSCDFLSHGDRCAAHLYLPNSPTSQLPPIVLMAHGFAAEAQFGLRPFAEQFIQNGMAVLLFDYRGFGQSEGHPRNWVSPKRHLQDWQAAIAHVRNLPQVDGSRLALWGSSYSGGHVIVTAAQTQGIRAISSQVPHVDAWATLRTTPWGYRIQAMGHMLRDALRSLAGQSPHYVPVVSSPQEFAVMNTPESYPGYTSLIPPDHDWLNQVTARSLFSFSFYSPRRFAAQVNCPALIVAGEQDSLIPIKAVQRTAKRIKHAKLIQYPIGHFDIYHGLWREKAIAHQVEFFKDNLL